MALTVSLFVTELAFGEEALGTDARLGVLTGSLVAALIGTGIMMPGSVNDDHSMDTHTSSDVDSAAETVTPPSKID